jgi:hypothetical protein
MPSNGEITRSGCGAAGDDVDQAGQQGAAAGQVDLVDAGVGRRGEEELDRARDFQRGVFQEGREQVGAEVVRQVAGCFLRASASSKDMP